MDRNFIARLLFADHFFRTQKRWPLVPLPEFPDEFSDNPRRFKSGADIIAPSAGYNYFSQRDPFVRTGPSSRRSHTHSKDNFSHAVFSERLYAHFEDARAFLCGELFPRGTVVAAGGAIFRCLYQRQFEDLDLFFVGVTPEEGQAMLRKACEYLEQKHPGDISIRQNRNVTEVVVGQKLATRGGTRWTWSNNDGKCGTRYQFIHRCYPSADTVIGGFDLGVSMAYFDGDMVFATPLGAFSLATRAIPIDLSRRSLSFESRIRKYAILGCFVVMTHVSQEELIESVSHLGIVTTGYMSRLHVSLARGLRIDPFTLRLSAENQFSVLSDYDLVQTTKIGNALAASRKEFDTLSWTGKSVAEVFDTAAAQRSVEWEFPNQLKRLWQGGAGRNINQTYVSQRLARTFFPDLLDTKANRDYRHRGYVLVTRKRLEEVAAGIEGVMRPENADFFQPNWITENPGRQWTSSRNPVVADIREWYARPFFRRALRIGIPEDVFFTVRCSALPGPNRADETSPLRLLPSDTVRLILWHVAHSLAEDGVQTALGKFNASESNDWNDTANTDSFGAMLSEAEELQGENDTKMAKVAGRADADDWVITKFDYSLAVDFAAGDEEPQFTARPEKVKARVLLDQWRFSAKLADMEDVLISPAVDVTLDCFTDLQRLNKDLSRVMGSPIWRRLADSPENCSTLKRVLTNIRAVSHCLDRLVILVTDAENTAEHDVPNGMEMIRTAFHMLKSSGVPVNISVGAAPPVAGNGDESEGKAEG